MKKRHIILLSIATMLIVGCASAQSHKNGKGETMPKRIQTYAIEQVRVPDMPALDIHVTLKANPKRDFILLRREQSIDVIYYELRDKDEKPLARGTWNSTEYRLDMEPFEPGVYFLKLYNFQDMQLMYRITKAAPKAIQQ